jgi:hypothetical protein
LSKKCNRSDQTGSLRSTIEDCPAASCGQFVRAIAVQNDC